MLINQLFFHDCSLYPLKSDDAFDHRMENFTQEYMYTVKYYAFKPHQLSVELSFLVELEYHDIMPMPDEDQLWIAT
jgi:hypothetical protein